MKQDPFSGQLFAFRGKKAALLKILFWDGNGLCLFTKRFHQGSFVWPRMTGYDGSITLTPAQLATLIGLLLLNRLAEFIGLNPSATIAAGWREGRGIQKLPGGEPDERCRAL